MGGRSGSARARLARLATLAVLSAGCYTLQPMNGVAPTPGMEIGLDISDVGRVSLGGTMGPEIEQVEGRLYAKDEGVYDVAVTSIHLLHGGEQRWTGERVRIREQDVSRVYEKRLSKERSLIAGAVGVGSVVWLATRSLLGGGQPDGKTPPPDTAHTQRRPGR